MKAYRKITFILIITQRLTVGGRQKRSTKKSAIARLEIAIFVTDRIE